MRNAKSFGSPFFQNSKGYKLKLGNFMWDSKERFDEHIVLWSYNTACIVMIGYIIFVLFIHGTCHGIIVFFNVTKVLNVQLV